MAGGQDGRATSALSLNDIQGSTEILNIVLRTWQSNRGVNVKVNVSRLSMMKDPWPLRIFELRIWVHHAWSQHHSWRSVLRPITYASLAEPAGCPRQHGRRDLDDGLRYPPAIPNLICKYMCPGSVASRRTKPQALLR